MLLLDPGEVPLGLLGLERADAVDKFAADVEERQSMLEQLALQRCHGRNETGLFLPFTFGVASEDAEAAARRIQKNLIDAAARTLVFEEVAFDPINTLVSKAF